MGCDWWELPSPNAAPPGLGPGGAWRGLRVGQVVLWEQGREKGRESGRREGGSGGGGEERADRGHLHLLSADFPILSILGNLVPCTRKARLQSEAPDGPAVTALILGQSTSRRRTPRPPTNSPDSAEETQNWRGLQGLSALLGVRKKGGSLCSGTPLSSHPWSFRTPGWLGAQQPHISS